MTGRPSSYTDEIGDFICEKIATGNALARICDHMGIGYAKVMHWLRDNEGFRQNYMQAREDQADWHHDEVLTIADDATLLPEDRRVRIDARKWSAGKMKPKRYGDKLQTEVSGPEGGPILTSSDEAIIAQTLALLARK